MVMEEAKIPVGTRIQSDGDHGTVMFYGQVPPTKGVWLGVDWDKHDRGKHDGSHNGHRYFHASHPMSGSFLRPAKAGLGVSLLEAVQDRYGWVDDSAGGVDEEEMFVLGHHQQTAVTVVGAKKVNKQQSQFDLLKEVVLRGTDVGHQGEPGSIGRTLPKVENLDISQNLLHSWEQVASIVEELPKLKSLNVSESRLEFPEESQKLCEKFKGVSTIYINRMNYSWNDVCEVAAMMPDLQQVHICFNQIQEISGTPHSLQNLNFLNLESNPIQEWTHVLKLGAIKSLERLILNDTGITTIEFADTPHGQKTTLFPALKSLSVGGNKITEVSCMDELNKLHCLTTLYYRNNPLHQADTTEETIRSNIIAKIKTLTSLNWSLISTVERYGTEIDYLKMHGQEWKDAGGNQDPEKNKPSKIFSQRHPRYQELINKHGAPEDSELKQHSSALKNMLINVTITCPAQPNKPPMKKKLPVSLTVQKLKAMLHRLYRVDSYSMNLSYICSKTKVEIEFDSELKEIGYFSIEEGDEIIIK